jgi:hypothetical protein
MVRVAWIVGVQATLLILTRLLIGSPDMDLSNFKPKSDEVNVILKDSDGEPIPKDEKTSMSITLHAKHSAEYKKVMHELANKRLVKAQKSKKISITSEEYESEAIERFVKITKSWDIILDGKCPALTYENVKQVYTSMEWILEQLAEALEESNSFTKA